MKTALETVYATLYRHYGPQGWWPTTPPGQFHPRYHLGTSCAPITPAAQWEIAVGALLTQNTAWRNVELALSNLSARGLLDLCAMHAMPPEELAACIRPSGYYNQKALRLRGLAAHIVDRYGGSIERFLVRPPAELRAELLSLKGIGPETADAILLYAARYPFFVIDAYTRRIFRRLGLIRADLSYAEMQSIFMDHLDADVELYAEYHALLVRLATTCCKSRPQCEKCCLRAACAHAECA